MNRLTHRNDRGRAQVERRDLAEAIQRLAAYEDCGVDPEDMRSLQNLISDAFGAVTPARALEIRTAEKEGRLLILPVPLGSNVYQLHPDYRDSGATRVGSYKLTAHNAPEILRNNAFGTTVFPTRKAALAALRPPDPPPSAPPSEPTPDNPVEEG